MTTPVSRLSLRSRILTVAIGFIGRSYGLSQVFIEGAGSRALWNDATNGKLGFE